MFPAILLGVIVFAIWFISRKSQKVGAESQKRKALEKSHEAVDMAKRTRDRLRNDAEYRKRVRDNFRRT